MDEPTPVESRLDYLWRVRRDTCYPTLRMLVDVLTVAGFVGTGVFLFTGIRLLQFINSNGVPTDKTWPALVTEILLCVVGTIVGRGLCLLLIDLTDATLEANSRPQNTQARQASPGKD